MFSLAAEQHNAAQEIMARSGANNLCLFLFDARHSGGGVNFLCHYGMSERVHRDYTAGLWVHDPFLLSLAKHPDPSTVPTVLERRQLENTQQESRPYWHYIDQVGYREIIAAIHPFTSQFFLVAGLMGQRRGGRYCAVQCEKVMVSLDKLVTETASDLAAEGARLLFPPVALPAEGDRALRLSPREREVALALRHGSSNKQIAAALMLSEYTIENHFKRLFRKFDVTNRTALLSRLQALSLIH